MRTARLLSALAVCPLLAASAAAEPSSTAPSTRSTDLVALSALDFSFPPAAAQETAEHEVPPLQPLPARFGTKGTSRILYQGGGGFRLNDTDNAYGLLGVGFGHFIADDLSLNLELNFGFYDLVESKNAWAGNLNLLFRWHFKAETNWSLYVDGGAGIMGSTQEVPRRGTNFNFTPQAGAGVSFDISRDARMLIGARWQHISNASLWSENPGMDNFYAYMGVSLPF